MITNPYLRNISHRNIKEVFIRDTLKSFFHIVEEFLNNFHARPKADKFDELFFSLSANLKIIKDNQDIQDFLNAKGTWNIDKIKKAVNQ